MLRYLFCLCFNLLLVSAYANNFLSILHTEFSAANAKLSTWTVDDWCRDLVTVSDGTPPKISDIKREGVFLSNVTVPVQAGDKFQGELFAAGQVKVGFGLYCYDNRGFIGAFQPAAYNGTVDANEAIKFAFTVPGEFKGRKPVRAKLFMAFKENTDCYLHSIQLNKAFPQELLLQQNKLAVAMEKDPAEFSGLWYENELLLRSMRFSWYGKGDWQNNSVGRQETELLEKSFNLRKSKYLIDDFEVEVSYEVLPEPEAMRFDFSLTALNDVQVGGGDPPGGAHFPALTIPDKFDHYLKINEDGSYSKYTRKDFPWMRPGFFEDNYMIARCDEKTEKGVLLLLDSRAYPHLRQMPFFNTSGLCWSRDAWRMFRKGEKIKGQLYCIPFSGDLQAKISAAKQAYCAPELAQRQIKNERYTDYENKAPESYYKMGNYKDFSVYAGAMQLILPEQKMPQKEAREIYLSAAKNETECAQISINPKKNIADCSVQLEGLEGIGVKLNYLELVPSNYATTHLGMKGIVPDILSEVGQRELQAGQNHSYVLTCSIPKDATAGIKEGKIIIRSADKLLAEFPVKLEIYDFALPTTSNFRTAFLLWTSRPYYDKGYKVQPYVDDLRKLRISSGYEIKVAYDKEGNLLPGEKDKLQSKVKAVLAAGDTCFRVEGSFSWRALGNVDKSTPEAEAFMRNFAKQIADSLREINALDKLFWLMVDETHWGEERMQRHIHWCKLVKEVAPDLPIFSTQNHPVKRLAEQVDIVCGPSSSMDVLQQHFADQKEYWYYDNGFYFALGHNSLTPRGLPWRSKVAGISGYHQWSATYWRENFEPGDGHGTSCFYYPAENVSDKAIRSLRLLSFAQGIEDYDYICLLEEKIAVAKNKAETKELAESTEKQLQEIIKSLTPDRYNFTASIAKVEKARKEIAALLMGIRE